MRSITSLVPFTNLSVTDISYRCHLPYEGRLRGFNLKAVKWEHSSQWSCSNATSEERKAVKCKHSFQWSCSKATSEERKAVKWKHSFQWSCNKLQVKCKHSFQWSCSKATSEVHFVQWSSPSEKLLKFSYTKTEFIKPYITKALLSFHKFKLLEQKLSSTVRRITFRQRTLHLCEA